MPKRLTDEEIISFVESINYTFLKFTDKKHRSLLIRCDKGHEYKTTFTNIYNKKRKCKLCSYKNKPPYKKIDLDLLKHNLSVEGYKLLNIKGKIPSTYVITYECNNKHIHSTRLYDLERGIRCGKCKGNIQVNLACVENSFNKEKYLLHTSIYINNMTLLYYTCPYGHNHTTDWKKWHRGTRCPTCAIIFSRGENSVHWKGGISCAPYCPIWLDKEYKADIRRRDNDICQNPYCYKNTTKLHIHHIDYDKKNCHPDNLVTVCGSCNSRANKDRDWHTDWYQTLMIKKFNYKY